MRARAVRVATWTVAALCALALLPAPFSVAPAARAAAPTVTFHAPPEARPGTLIVARGRVSGLGAPGSLRGQLLVGGRWKTLGRRAVSGGRFRLALRLPNRGAAARLRAVVVVGGRRVATSPTARVELARPARARPAVQPASNVPSPATAGPATAGPPASAATPALPVAPLESIYWGGYIDPEDSSQPAPINPATIERFQAMAGGKPPSLLESFSAFVDCSGGPCVPIGFPAAQLEAIRNRGAVPFFTWAPEATSGERHQPSFQLSDIIAGAHDAYITAWAEAARAWGHPFFLRFGWEMNGNWYPWSVGTVPVGSGKTTAEKEEEGKVANGNSPDEYALAWQHVHQIFSAVGATNATWVWCPYINPNGGKNLAPLAGLYPGDEYVDWTCLDGYNYGTLQSNSRWRTFAELFGPQYLEITGSIAPSKPMLIAEVASSESGGSKAAWIAEMFAALPTSFPAVRGLMWFEYLYDGNDWWLQSSLAAQQAFAAGVADPHYPTNLFAGLATSPIPAP